MHAPSSGPTHQTMGSTARLSDGCTVGLRPIAREDAAALVRFHEGLSPESKQRRFFSPHPHLSSSEVEHFTDVDHREREALVALHDDAIVGIGRYEGSPGADAAEVAFVVTDAWQHRGIATVLLREVASRARAAGFHRLFAETLVENRPMIDVFEHSGLPVDRTYDGATIHYVMSLSTSRPGEGR